jgi:hypothetical protein
VNNESCFIPLSCGNERQNGVGLYRKTSAGVHLDVVSARLTLVLNEAFRTK